MYWGEKATGICISELGFKLFRYSKNDNKKVNFTEKKLEKIHFFSMRKDAAKSFLVSNQ